MTNEAPPPGDASPPTSTTAAADRIAALQAARAAGVRPGSRPKHAAQGARRVTLIASMVAVAGLTGGFAFHAAAAQSASAAASQSSSNAAMTKSTTASTTAANPVNTGNSTGIVVTSQGS